MSAAAAAWRNGGWHLAAGAAHVNSRLGARRCGMLWRCHRRSAAGAVPLALAKRYGPGSRKQAISYHREYVCVISGMLSASVACGGSARRRIVSWRRRPVKRAWRCTAASACGASQRVAAAGGWRHRRLAYVGGKCQRIICWRRHVAWRHVRKCGAPSRNGL